MKRNLIEMVLTEDQKKVAARYLKEHLCDGDAIERETSEIGEALYDFIKKFIGSNNKSIAALEIVKENPSNSDSLIYFVKCLVDASLIGSCALDLLSYLKNNAESFDFYHQAAKNNEYNLKKLMANHWDDNEESD